MKGILLTSAILIFFYQVFCSYGKKLSKRENKDCSYGECEEAEKRALGFNHFFKQSSPRKNCKTDSISSCYSNNECCSGFCDTDSRVCKPQCGRSDLNLLQPTASNSRNAKHGEFPWHAGIYRYQIGVNSYVQICGGTLISAKVVITAAYHVTKKPKFERPDERNSTLKVAVGKYYRELYSALDELAQIIDVEKLEIPPNYQVQTDPYLTNNIALLTLKEEVVYSRVVRPVCIDLGSDDFEQEQLIRGAIGIAAGWGITADKKPSETLKIIEMPYVPRDECTSKLSKDILPYLTDDRMCAKGDDSSNVTLCKGDSGGGLIFKDHVTNAYYLRGVVSVGPKGCKGGEIVLFTKISYFKDLIKNYVQDCNKISHFRTCGRSVNQAVVSQARNAEINEFPWHVGIYQHVNDSYEHFCGGTLISRKAVVSAAYCFATARIKSERITVKDPATLKVAVGKHNRDFNAVEDNLAQILDVENIEISDQYLGSMALHANDIVFLTLKTEVKLSPAVRPVCTDIGDDTFENEQLAEDSIGRIATWEIATDESTNDTLKILDIPYVSRDDCKNKINYKYISSVSEDKICAGDKISKATLRGLLSGEGLAFEDAETNAYYLRGVVSLSPPEGQEIVLLTKLSFHRKLVEKYVEDCGGTCKRKKCKPLTSIKLTVNCFNPNGQPARCDVPLPTNSKANFSCNPPSYYKIKNPEYNTIQCKNGQWDRPLIDNFCHAVCGQLVSRPTHDPVVSYGKKIEYGEFPWHAGIYEYMTNTKSYEQICGGTLISHKIVVTAAHCVSTEMRDRNITVKNRRSLKIALGKYYRIFNASEEALAQIIDVKKIEIPWRYLGFLSLYEYDIAFITLKRTVEFSIAVAPVCLDIGKNTFEEDQLRKGRVGKVVGWGLTLKKTLSETLVMANMPFVPRNDCVSEITNALIIPANRDNMICAGDKSSSMTVCKGDSGGGLVFEESESQNFYLRGIVSLGPRGCEGKEYALFTKLSSYKEVLKKYLDVP